MEQEIKEIESHVLKCRPGDWNHAKRVAKWTEILGKDRKDLSLLLIASYIHDIGWRNVIGEEKITLENLLKFEPQANANSEPFIREVLEKLKYSNSDIETVLRLVSAADKHESNQDDEAIIVDADSLSKLDINHLKEKFQPDEWMKLYKLWEGKFSQRVRTEKAKELYPDLLEKLKKEIIKEFEKF